MKKLLLTLFSIIALCHTSYAAPAWSKMSYFQNWGGLNDNISPTEIADGEATDIQNVIFDNGGSLRKRYGFHNITYPAANYALDSNVTGVPGVYLFQKSNGNKYLIAVGNSGGQATMYYKQLDASGNVPAGAWTSQGTTNLPSSFTNDQYVTFSTANDTLVMTVAGTSSNLTYPSAWQATGNIYNFTTNANCPKAKYNVFHKNMLFLAGDTSNPSRISFSDLTNGITYFYATDFFDLDKNNGQYITGMVSIFGNLYIFENNSIWMLSGSTRDDFSLQKMVDNIGAAGQQSIQVVNNTIYFITPQNDIAEYDGNFSVKFLSSKIRNNISSNNFTRAPQSLGLAFSSYRYKDLDYYAAESTVGINTNNNVLLFDTYRQAWTKLTGINPNSWCVIPNQSGVDEMVFGGYDGAVYFYPNIGTYADVSNTCSGGNSCTTTSTAIYSFYQSKWFRYSDLALGDKYLKLIKTYILNSSSNSCTLQMTVNTDYQSSGSIYVFNYSPSGSTWNVSIWGTATWGGGGLNIFRQEINQGKQMFQVRYSNNVINQDMTILGWDDFVESTDQV